MSVSLSCAVCRAFLVSQEKKETRVLKEKRYGVTHMIHKLEKLPKEHKNRITFTEYLFQKAKGSHSHVFQRYREKPILHTVVFSF